MNLANWQEEEKLQCLLEKAIKDIQQQELPRINIQTLVKANLTKNFNLDTENQYIKPTDFIRSISAIGFTASTKNTSANGFTKNTKPTEFFSILEDITQHLLKSKHTLTFGQLFKIASYLRQYVATKLVPRRRIITTSRPNLVITLVASDPHVDVIQVQVGKNMVEYVLLDGGSKVNIIIEELRNGLGFPNLKPTSNTLGMADQTITKPIGFIKDFKIHIHGISYIATFIVMKKNSSMNSFSHSLVVRLLW